MFLIKDTLSDSYFAGFKYKPEVKEMIPRWLGFPGAVMVFHSKEPAEICILANKLAECEIVEYARVEAK